MGMGHVPAGPLRQERQGDDVPRREHRRARADLGSVAAASPGHELPRTLLDGAAVGRLGESVAAWYFQERGVTIVDRNTRVGRGELDLVIRIGGELAAVEVKTGGTSSDPIYHFDQLKQQQVRSLAGRRGIGRVDYVGVTVSAAGVTVRWLPRVC